MGCGTGTTLGCSTGNYVSPRTQGPRKSSSPYHTPSGNQLWLTSSRLLVINVELQLFGVVANLAFDPE